MRSRSSDRLRLASLHLLLINHMSIIGRAAKFSNFAIEDCLRQPTDIFKFTNIHSTYHRKVKYATPEIALFCKTAQLEFV